MMNVKYTPTTDDVRAYYVWAKSHRVGMEGGIEFDRWLAAHDAEVAAEAIRRVSDDIPVDLWATYGRLPRESVLEIQKWIRERADRINRRLGIHRDTRR